MTIAAGVSRKYVALLLAGLGAWVINTLAVFAGESAQDAACIALPVVWLLLAVWLRTGGRWTERALTSLILTAGFLVGLGFIFKVARLALAPFGTEVEYGGHFGSLLLNVLWIVFGGLELCIVALVAGAVCCITIVGIPAGIQSFKFAKLALMPFGSSVR